MGMARNIYRNLHGSSLNIIFNTMFPGTYLRIPNKITYERTRINDWKLHLR